MSSTTIRRMAALELFSGCHRSELMRIDQLGTTVDVEAGRTLCEEGTPGAEFFVLVAGDVVVSTTAGTLALLRAGAWFGEVALIHRSPRRATVTAETHATLLVFNRREFNCMLAISACVRARIRRSADLVAEGAAPTRQHWYQPLPRGFPRVAFDGSATGGRP